jgi:selenocysteine lyase/cysteine desulfurase
MGDDSPTTPLSQEAFPVTERWIYLNNAGRAPLSRGAADALAEFGRESSRSGCLAFNDQMARVERTRELAAQLMGTSADEVAFIKNTTEGLAFVANGFPWEAGDRILIPSCEFPSTRLAFSGLASRGVDIDLVEPEGPGATLPIERFAAQLAAAPHPTMVVVSWVQFAQGWRTDLRDLASACHEVGAILCVNAIQGLGVLTAEFGAIGVDIAVADGHKWMLGPEGAGVLSITAEHLDRLVPTELGWNSVVPRGDWSGNGSLDPTARRFEGGSLNLAGIAGLGASLELLLGAGIDRIEHHVDRLCDQLVAGLTASGRAVISDRGRGRSPIVTFDPLHARPEDLCAGLRSHGVVTAPRATGVRLSPHAYVSADDIAAALEAIDRCDRPDPVLGGTPPALAEGLR